MSVVLMLLATIMQVSAFTCSSNVRLHDCRRSLEMKGRGSKVPINQRGEFLKRQRMIQAKEQIDQTKTEGVPVFKVYVRPKKGGLWIPVGDLAGDARATAICNAWMSGFLTDMYKTQLDQGIAKSVFTQEDQFAQGIIDNYKPFKKFTKDDLEFGYKVEYEGLEAKVGEQKIMAITRGMEKGWGDEISENLKETFGGLFGGGNKDKDKK